jgi:hypothetical protein
LCLAVAILENIAATGSEKFIDWNRMIDFFYLTTAKIARKKKPSGFRRGPQTADGLCEPPQ